MEEKKRRELRLHQELGKGKFGQVWSLKEEAAHEKTEDLAMKLTKILTEMSDPPFSDQTLRELVFLNALKGEPHLVQLFAHGFLNNPEKGTQLHMEQGIVRHSLASPLPSPLPSLTPSPTAPSGSLGKRKRTDETKSKREDKEATDVALVLQQYVADLFDTLEKKSLVQNQLLDIFFEMLCGLRTLHSHYIVYNDLKPENVLLDRKQHAYLSDFGLSVPLHWASQTCHVATLVYTAPENIGGLVPCSEASDAWSLAATTFAVFFKVPLVSDDDPALYKQMETWSRNRAMIRVLMYFFGTSLFIGPPSAEWLHKFLPNQVIPTLSNMLAEMKKEKSGLHHLAVKTKALHLKYMKPGPCLILWKEVIQPMLLVYDPAERKSLASVDHAARMVLESKTEHAFPECAPLTHEHLPSSYHHEWSKAKLTDEQGKLFESIIHALVAQLPRLSVDEVTRWKTETYQIATQIALEYRQTYPLTKTVTPATIFLVALWLALKFTFQFEGLPLYDFCTMTFPDPNHCVSASMLQKIARQMLRRSLPLLSSRF